MEKGITGYSCDHVELHVLVLPIPRLAWIQRDSLEVIFDTPIAPLPDGGVIVSPNVPDIAGACSICGEYCGWHKSEGVVETPPDSGRRELGNWRERAVGLEG